MLSPAYKYVNETEPRVPLTDWYEATDGRSINMRARSVVGGFFMKMLEKQMYKPSFRPEPAEEPVVEAKSTYRNPVIDYSLPDPTIIKADDGYFYLYATEDIRNTPIHRSRNLVDWEEIGTAFTEETRPTFEPKGGLWAPDINYVDGQYVINPDFEQRSRSRLHLTVAGTADAVMMVEAGANEISEQEMLDAILFGHEYIKQIVEWIKTIQAEVGKEKIVPVIHTPDEELKAKVGIKKSIAEYGISEETFMSTLDQMVEDAFDDQCTGANPRYPLMSEIRQMYLNAYYGN